MSDEDKRLPENSRSGEVDAFLKLLRAGQPARLQCVLDDLERRHLEPVV